MNKELLSLLNSIQHRINKVDTYQGIKSKLEEVQVQILQDMLTELKMDEFGLTYAEQQAARRPDGKIPAIKLYRNRTICGLKEAKDAVEKWMQAKLGFTSHPYPYSPLPLEANDW